MGSYPGVTSVRVTFPFPEHKSVHFHSQAVDMKGNRKRTLILLRKQVAQLSHASWVFCCLPGCSCLSCRWGPAQRVAHLGLPLLDHLIFFRREKAKAFIET